MSVLVCDASQRHRFTLLLASEEGELLWQAPPTTDGRLGSSGGALEALHAHGLEGCTACIATDGPGSYTGLRAALSVVGGIAHVRNLPIHLMGALIPPVIFLGAGVSPVWSMCDAGRSGCYLGAYVWDGTAVVCAEDPVRTEPGEGMERTGGIYAAYQDDPVCSIGAMNGGCDPALALAGAVPAALAGRPVELASVQLTYAVPSVKEHAG